MTPSPADPALLLDEALIHFDQAWQHGTPPELADYLQRLPDELRREGLEELIKIDLECRWRRDAASAAVTANLDAYAQRFLALAAMPVSLIAWEYRVRHCWGDKPTHDEYTRRFADRGDEVRAALTQVDRDLADEFNAPSASHDLESAPADLLDELRRLRLLPLDQLNELRRLLLLGECNETRDLMRLLSERNWLTPYQAAKLAQGEAGELRVGPYVLLDRLGEGGVGQVFKAHHQDMNRMVALKVIRPEYLGDPDMVARFYREIQLTAQLEHVNLVHAFDAGPIGNLHVLIMEYVEGRDLGTLVKQEGALPMERACNYIRQAATGLQYIFEGNLVHRDIKPSNLVLTHTLSMERSANQSGPVATTAYPWGLVKILDLGLARFRRTDLNAQGDSASAHTLTDPGAVVMMGTPDFMAPEQILDFHGADIRADIYSLGCTYYYLLTGQAPFAEGTVSQKLVRHQQEDPPALENIRADVWPGLPELLARMLAKRPKDRYQTPAELIADLDRLANGDFPAAEMPAVSRADPAAAQLRRAALAGVLALLAIGVTALVWPDDEPKAEPDKPVAIAPLPKAVEKTKEKEKSPPLALVDPLLPAEKVALVQGKLKAPPPGLQAVVGDTRTGHESPAMDFSPDGRSVAAGRKDGTVVVWDLEEAGAQTVVGLHDRPVTALAYRWDGLLASAGEDGQVKLWNPKTGQAAGKPLNHKVPITRLAFSFDGRLLASGCNDGHVHIWQVPGGGLLHSFKDHNALISALSFSSDGERLAAAGWDGTTAVHWFDTKRPVRTTNLPAHRLSVCEFAPSGLTLFVGGSDGKTSILEAWDAAKRKKPQPLAGWPGALVHLAVRRDGKLLALSTIQGFTGHVSLRDPTDGKERRNLAFGCRVFQVCFSPQGDRLAINHGNGLVSIVKLP